MPSHFAVYRSAILAATIAACLCVFADAEAQTEEQLDFWLSVVPDKVINPTFAQTSPVSREGGRKNVVGCSHVCGQVQIQTVPSADRAVLRLELSGSSVAQNANVVARGRTIQTADTCQFCVNQMLCIDANGIVAECPSTNASARRQFLRARTPAPPVRDLLFRGGANSAYRWGQSSINRAASQVAKAELRKTYFEQRSQRLDQWKQFYDNQVRTQIEQLGLNAARLQFSSNETNIDVKHYRQTAVGSAPPVIGDQPIRLCLHQSAINRRLHESFSGRTLTSGELDEAFATTVPLVNLPELPESDEKPWAMTFADDEPFSLKLSNNTARLKIRGEHFQSEDRASPAMDLTVDYTLVRNETGWIAERAEEIQVFPPGFEPGMKLGVRQQVLRTVLQRRFNRLLPQKISFADLDFGAGNGGGSSNPLFLVEIDTIVADNGWIGVGIMRK